MARRTSRTGVPSSTAALHKTPTGLRNTASAKPSFAAKGKTNRHSVARAAQAVPLGTLDALAQMQAEIRAEWDARPGGHPELKLPPKPKRKAK